MKCYTRHETPRSQLKEKKKKLGYLADLVYEDKIPRYKRHGLTF
jgi:hypothetical protein